MHNVYNGPARYMRKIVLNFIFDCSSLFFFCVSIVVVACEHFACHLLHWCGRLKIGMNITSRTYVYLFVTSIQCSIQLLYINQAAAYVLFWGWERMEKREDTSFQSECLTYSFPLMWAKKKEEKRKQTKMKRCAAKNWWKEDFIVLQTPSYKLHCIMDIINCLCSLLRAERERVRLFEFVRSKQKTKMLKEITKLLCQFNWNVNWIQFPSICQCDIDGRYLDLLWPCA